MFMGVMGGISEPVQERENPSPDVSKSDRQLSVFFLIRFSSNLQSLQVALFGNKEQTGNHGKDQLSYR